MLLVVFASRLYFFMIVEQSFRLSSPPVVLLLLLQHRCWFIFPSLCSLSISMATVSVPGVGGACSRRLSQRGQISCEEDAALSEMSRTVCGLVTPAGYREAHGRYGGMRSNYRQRALLSNITTVVHTQTHILSLIDLTFYFSIVT